MTLDIVANLERNVEDALLGSCFIDPAGNLYTLKEGLIAAVAGPDVGGESQFQGCGGGSSVRWAATQNRLFIYFKCEAKHLCVPISQTVARSILSNYRACTVMTGDGGVIYFFHNDGESVYCYKITVTGARLLRKIKGHNGRGAWMENELLNIFGMKARVRLSWKWFFWLKYGEASVHSIDLSGRGLRASYFRRTKNALLKAWMASASKEGDIYVKPLLEVWLDTIAVDDGRVLIGGIADRRQPEWYWTWEAGVEVPLASDFEGAALYRWKSAGMDLLRLIPHFAYVGKLDFKDIRLLYFDGSGEEDDNYASLEVSGDMQLPLRKVEFEWSEDGYRTVEFSPFHDEEFGIMGAVIIRKKGGALVDASRYLVSSQDGIRWRLCHALA